MPIVEPREREREHARSVADRLAVPQHPPRAHVGELERQAIVVQVPPQAEDRAGDGRAAFPEPHRATGRQVERFAARGRAAEGILDVDRPGVGAVQRPRAPGGHVAQQQPHSHAVIADAGGIGDHRAGEEPLPAFERQSEEQPRDLDLRRLLARGEEVQADGEKQLAVLRVAQVEMVQHVRGQDAAGFVHDLDARAVQRGADGNEDMAERQPDHRIVPGRGCGEVDRGKFDHEPLLADVHPHGGERQRRGRGRGRGRRTREQCGDQRGEDHGDGHTSPRSGGADSGRACGSRAKIT